MSGTLGKISAIICTKDRPEDLRRFFESLDAQELLPIEALVVDASAGGETKKFVDEKRASGCSYALRYIKAAPGLTHQRNIGLDASRGELVAYFDDDVVLEKEFLLAMSRTFAEFSHLPLGGVTGRIVNVPPRRRGVQAFFKRAFFLSDTGRGRIKLSGFPEHRVNDEPGFVGILSGGCTAYDREAVLRHRFDEKLTGYSYMEDVDFSSRLAAGGYLLYYQPAARLTHLSHTHENGDSRRLRRMLVSNHSYLFMKNSKKDFPHWAAFAWSLVGIFLFNILISKDIQAVRGALEGLIEAMAKKGPGGAAPRPGA